MTKQETSLCLTSLRNVEVIIEWFSIECQNQSNYGTYQLPVDYSALQGIVLLLGGGVQPLSPNLNPINMYEHGGWQSCPKHNLCRALTDDLINND